jgi:CheY-like chemotaxis protein
MEIRGLIKDTTVTSLLEQAEAEEQTGVLYLKGEGTVGEVSFENGMVYAADSPLVRERIGQRLIVEGLVHPSDLYQALRDQENHGNLALGELLSQKNLLPFDRLKQIMELQIEEAVLHLAMWERGKFSFERKARRKEHSVLVRPSQILKKKQHLRELKHSTPKNVIGLIEQHADPLVRYRFHEEIEKTISRTDKFEPRIMVVLVEGNARMRMMVHDELIKHNFSVKVASDVGKARSQVDRLLAQGYSPIVVTDVDFPRQKMEMQLEGLSFMETLHQEHPEIPVLVSTSYPISNLRRKILFLGGIFCLVKPDLSVLSSRNFEQVFKSYIRELGYCLDLSIQQYYQEYYRERAEIVRDDLIEDLYHARNEVIGLGKRVVEDSKIHDLYFEISDMLVRQGNVDGAIERTMGFLKSRFDHVALFLWGKKYLNGYLGGSSQRADFGEKVEKVSVEYAAIPFLANLYKKKAVFIGTPPQEEPYLKFLDRFVPVRPVWHLLYPVEVLGKVVALWYTDLESERESIRDSHILMALFNLLALALKMDIEEKA